MVMLTAVDSAANAARFCYFKLQSGTVIDSSLSPHTRCSHALTHSLPHKLSLTTRLHFQTDWANESIWRLNFVCCKAFIKTNFNTHSLKYIN